MIRTIGWFSLTAYSTYHLQTFFSRIILGFNEYLTMMIIPISKYPLQFQSPFEGYAEYKKLII